MFFNLIRVILKVVLVSNLFYSNIVMASDCSIFNPWYKAILATKNINHFSERANSYIKLREEKNQLAETIYDQYFKNKISFLQIQKCTLGYKEFKHLRYTLNSIFITKSLNKIKNVNHILFQQISRCRETQRKII